MYYDYSKRAFPSGMQSQIKSFLPWKKKLKLGSFNILPYSQCPETWTFCSFNAIWRDPDKTFQAGAVLFVSALLVQT